MKKDIKRPFVFYKNIKVAWSVLVFVWLVVAVGITFTCIEPLLQYQYMDNFLDCDRTTFLWISEMAVMCSCLKEKEGYRYCSTRRKR